MIPIAFYNADFRKKVFFLRIAMTSKMLYNENVKQLAKEICIHPGRFFLFKETKDLRAMQFEGLVFLFMCLLFYFPNFFLNASVNAGTIWNRSPTTP
jgi:hypothetical protein